MGRSRVGSRVRVFGKLPGRPTVATPPVCPTVSSCFTIPQDWRPKDKSNREAKPFEPRRPLSPREKRELKRENDRQCGSIRFELDQYQGWRDWWNQMLNDARGGPPLPRDNPGVRNAKEKFFQVQELIDNGYIAGLAKRWRNLGCGPGLEKFPIVNDKPKRP